MFGSASSFSPGIYGSLGLGMTTTTGTHNPMKDFEVLHPPDDSIQALKFSPPSIPQNFLVSGSWDNSVRVWEVKQDGKTETKAEQKMNGPVLEIDWADDGSKIFIACADRTVKIWDIASSQIITLGQHENAVKTCNWIKAPTYSCLMTGSWDKTLKFWDIRSPGNSMASVSLPERVYCADVMYPMAAVGTADKNIKIYKLEGQPVEVKTIESPLRFQHRCISIFKDRATNAPVGFALGSIEGRVAIQYVDTVDVKANFTFKCHRSAELVNGYQDIYAVNDMCFHPQHGTLATVGSDGRYFFWDKDARTKLKMSEKLEQPITRCCLNKTGDIFAYSVSYDWSKGHEFYNPQQKNYIFLHGCSDDMKPRSKK
ncbi:unnamed protein product [Soboliphyme baturini]|uniref:WD_REPEATS_REGION domain-containing protein n=1 Tax=Soboliphyme baturini TaxID=241478 RepID=A0A183IRG7_9BILA|nr:unnamed protein product [Soboliphyme baturini]